MVCKNEVFCQIVCYLLELFNQVICYLAEMFCQIACSLAELFRQIAEYLAELFRQVAFPYKIDIWYPCAHPAKISLAEVKLSSALRSSAPPCLV